MQPTSRSRRRAPLVLLMASLGSLSSACAGDEPDDMEPNTLTLEQRIDTLADCTPTDLTVLAPWMGPAFDPETGALLEPLPAGHVEAVVNGWLDYGEEATALRVEQATIVLMDALTRDGLLGFESVESVECDIAISHTLWRDEAAMFAFVTAPPHAKAMSLASKTQHAGAGAHWTGERRTEPPTWREGIDRYVEELREE
jgi:heme-degrading monooxygenase HmoA